MTGTMNFRSNGKLLISGEYTVLDGAAALALPTKFGQELSISESASNRIHWTSIDHKGHSWLKTEIDIESSEQQNSSNLDDAQLVASLLRESRKMNPDFLSGSKGYLCRSSLEFPRDWGLGSSSTLIYNMASWAGVDPFELSDRTLGGSGYDIAAAGQPGPILYQRQGAFRRVKPVKLAWTFKNSLFFVHLNRKQDSRKGIAHYRALNDPKNISDAIAMITEISESLPGMKELAGFKDLLEEHDRITSSLLGLPTIKEQLFSDYPGVVKSLGAWGGDFIMVSGDDEAMDYFRNKGYQTILTFSEMIQ